MHMAQTLALPALHGFPGRSGCWVIPKGLCHTAAGSLILANCWAIRIRNYSPKYLQRFYTCS